MKRLIEVGRETYGHDARAINRHSERKYRDEQSRFYILSRTLDGVPPFFEAYGPYTAQYEGALPQLRIDGQECWGDGWSWNRAVRVFCKELDAQILPGGASP